MNAEISKIIPSTLGALLYYYLVQTPVVDFTILLYSVGIS